jgi:NADPH:quinone reductase-like Zn-dependent oxidoreductase
MLRTIKFAEAGGPEVLEFVETAVPAPGPAEVRINVQAIGINRADSMWRKDVYMEPVKFPAGLGYEAAGFVDAVGSDLTGFAVGDEVSVIPSFSLNQYFTYGEVITVPDYAVVKHPKLLSLVQAASVWMMFVTAYGVLIEDAEVGKGDFVLIPAASSSVGLAAIQIANYAGATSVALTRTSAKAKQLLDAGAAHVIVTDEVDLVEQVMRITDGKGARVAFDAVGGPNFPKLVSALAVQGTVYIYGALAEGETPLPVMAMIAKTPVIKGYNIWLTVGDETRRKAAVDYVLKGLQSGALKPVIDSTFAFDEMVKVHHYLESNSQFGKIVVTVKPKRPRQLRPLPIASCSGRAITESQLMELARSTLFFNGYDRFDLN